ncbi:hypothetical protein ACFL1I_05580 [Candidatus Omnitrophota bacterium]
MAPKSEKRLIFKFSALILSALIFILGAEIILRLCGPKYYRFNNLSSEYYTNPRGYHIPLRKEGPHTIYGLNYTSSREGYRLPDRPPFFDENKQNRILGLGDSFTYGRSVKYEDIYLTKLEGLLKQDLPNLGIKNCARVALDLEDILAIYFLESAHKHFPLVIYGFVLNDFGLPGKERIVGLDFIDINNSGYTFNRLRQISRLYNLIWYALEKRMLHQVTIKAYQQAFEGEYAKKKFQTLNLLNRLITGKGSKLVIVLFPLLYDFENYYFSGIHQKLAEFCEQQDILLLDLLPAFSEYPAEALWANPIDHHPNEIAHRLAAEEIAHFLRQHKLLSR